MVIQLMISLAWELGAVSLLGTQSPAGQLCRTNYINIAYRMRSLISADEFIRECETGHKPSLLQPENSSE